MRDWRDYVRGHLSLPSLAPEREERIVRELGAQLEDFYRDALAGGMDEAAADAHARAQIDDWSLISREVLRADRPHRQSPLLRLADRFEADPHRGGPMLLLSHVLRDLRFGVRQLAQTPAFSLVAVLTLGLGIGATAAMFSVVNGVLLRPLPFADPERLVRVHEVVPQYGRFAVAPATFLDWRAQSTSFEQLAAYQGSSGSVVWSDGPERIAGAAVSWNLFELLHARPALGSTFDADQDRPGQAAVVVLSHGLWQRRFGGDPGVVGKSISMDGAPATVLGVMPAGFYFPARTTEFWRPVALPVANPSRGAHYLGVVGRTKAGVSLEQAHAEMSGLSERLALQYPETSAKESAAVVGLHEQIVGRVRPALWTLLLAVGAVVLIACANIANLLLARALTRAREIAVRTALGASRGRLLLQMLAESAILAVCGGALGLALAFAAIPAIRSLSAGSIPRVNDVTIDGTVLAFTVAASLLTCLLFGLAPALHLARGPAAAALREGGRSAVGGGGRWLRNGLLVGEVALSLALLVGATLLLRSFDRLTGVDPGFRAEGVLEFEVSLPEASYPDAPRRLAFYDSLLERLKALPAVTSAALVQSSPVGGGYVLSVTVQGQPAPKPGDEPSATFRSIAPDYFDTLGIPLRRGRQFTAHDAPQSAPVVIVDESFVRRHFPGQDPIGQRLDVGNGTKGAEVVGVVGDVKYDGLDSELQPTMYVPHTQDVFSAMVVLVRAQGDPLALANPVRQALRELDRALPADSLASLASRLQDSVGRQRFSMLLLTLFGLVALFLAAVGLYGVVGYNVSQRTREIGLRMAIGAEPASVMRMVLGGGLRVTLVGVVLGLALALALSRLMASMLFQVQALDPWSYAITVAVLLAVAVLACFVPARRAMRVDPLVALQE